MGNTTKVQYTIPIPIAVAVNQEATKRINELKLGGQKMVGSMERDIFCVAVSLSLNRIQTMSAAEFVAAVKRACNGIDGRR